MIYFLQGVIESIQENLLTINVNGVGYGAFASSRTLASFAEGEVTTVYTYTQVRETEFTLFGFANQQERDVFEVLISVSGVGAKVGLAIMSALSVEEIAYGLANQDGKTFARASGVGPKLGDKIVLELKGKRGSKIIAMVDGDAVINFSGADGGSVITSLGGVGVDVASALANLGYKAMNAQKAVSKAVDKSPEDSDFDVIFKASLAELKGMQ